MSFVLPVLFSSLYMYFMFIVGDMSPPHPLRVFCKNCGVCVCVHACVHPCVCGFFWFFFWGGELRSKKVFHYYYY